MSEATKTLFNFKVEVTAGQKVFSVASRAFSGLVSVSDHQKEVALFFSDSLRAILWIADPDLIIVEIPYPSWTKMVLPSLIRERVWLGLNWDDGNLAFPGEEVFKALN